MATGVNEQELSGLIIYPNPTSGQLHLEGHIEGSGVNVVLYNGQGQVMQRLESQPTGGMLQESLDLYNYPAGIYILEARSGHRLTHLKVVKQ